MRNLNVPGTIDHMHWYRLLGAVRLREQDIESASAPPDPAVQTSGEARAASPETARGADPTAPTGKCRVCGADTWGGKVVCLRDKCVDSHVFAQAALADYYQRWLNSPP